MIFDKLIRLLIPQLLAVLVIIISIQPLSISGISNVMPMLEVVFIYYWGIRYPKVFPAWFVVLIGLLQDVLYGTPLGMTSFSNIVLLSMVISQRKFLIKEPFWVQWGSFALFSFIISVVKWVLALILLHTMEVSNIVWIQWLLTWAIYIFVHTLFDKIYKPFATNIPYA